jgi:hypothetical protein
MSHWPLLTDVDFANSSALTTAGLAPFFEMPPPLLSTMNLEGILLLLVPIMVTMNRFMNRLMNRLIRLVHTFDHCIELLPALSQP